MFEALSQGETVVRRAVPLRWHRPGGAVGRRSAKSSRALVQRTIELTALRGAAGGLRDEPASGAKPVGSDRGGLSNLRHRVPATALQCRAQLGGSRDHGWTRAWRTKRHGVWPG